MREFDKYYYYQNAVQSPENDAEFLESTYKEIRGFLPKVMREDFCAAFALCCEWVKRKPQYEAFGLDIDPEPIQYGKKNYLTQLNSEHQSRVHIMESDVLGNDLPPADIIAALNFSYFCFKERKLLLQYFKACHRSLNDNGLLIMDCFGGPSCMEPNVSETEYDDFSYFWDQDTYNPINHHAMFYIHFKRKGEKLRNKVFTYDWRLWSLAELKDLADEAGFSKVHFYWEGTDKHGEGDGIFTRTTEGEICDAWVAYLIAEK
ncbi:MAG: class I SAM-dependent methyltransferase [Oligoflexus sp.]